MGKHLAKVMIFCLVRYTQEKFGGVHERRSCVFVPRPAGPGLSILNDVWRRCFVEQQTCLPFNQYAKSQ
jgi:hypothetical protein